MNFTALGLMPVALVFLIASGLPIRALAWDAADCADATKQLARAAREASDAGDDLESSASGSKLSAVRSAIADVESSLSRARSTCGIRASSAAINNEIVLRQIEAWSKEKQKFDPQYKRIEVVLLPLIGRVIRTLPSEHWLPTMRLMYDALSVQSLQ